MQRERRLETQRRCRGRSTCRGRSISTARLTKCLSVAERQSTTTNYTRYQCLLQHSRRRLERIWAATTRSITCKSHKRNRRHDAASRRSVGFRAKELSRPGHRGERADGPRVWTNVSTGRRFYEEARSQYRLHDKWVNVGAQRAAVHPAFRNVGLRDQRAATSTSTASHTAAIVWHVRQPRPCGSQWEWRRDGHLCSCPTQRLSDGASVLSTFEMDTSWRACYELRWSASEDARKRALGYADTIRRRDGRVIHGWTIGRRDGPAMARRLASDGNKETERCKWATRVENGTAEAQALPAVRNAAGYVSIFDQYQEQACRRRLQRRLPESNTRLTPATLSPSGCQDEELHKQSRR